jgi:hypothetical protein
MGLLGIGTLVAGVLSWRHNASGGLHQHDLATPSGGRPPGRREPLASDGE